MWMISRGCYQTPILDFLAGNFSSDPSLKASSFFLLFIYLLLVSTTALTHHSKLPHLSFPNPATTTPHPLQNDNPKPYLCNHFLRDLSRTKHPGNALNVFDEMLRRGIGVDKFSFSLVLKAIGRVKAVDEGMMVHGLVVKKGFSDDSFVETGLVGMYALCGEIVSARMVFDRMSQRYIVTWKIMIDGTVRVDCLMMCCYFWKR